MTGHLPVKRSIRAAFPTTAWSRVHTALDRDAEGRRAALDQLLASYRRPIYCYFRSLGVPPDESDDTTQEFLLRTLEQGFVPGVREERGSLRRYLKTRLRWFLQERRKVAGRRPALLRTSEEPSLPAESSMDREWARTVLERGLRQAMRRSWNEGRRLEVRVVGDWWRDLERGTRKTYRELAQLHGITEGQVTHALHAFRVRLRSEILAIVSDSLDVHADPESEYAELMNALVESS